MGEYIFTNRFWSFLKLQIFIISIFFGYLFELNLCLFSGQANYMHWLVDKVPDQLLLNTTGWRYIVPKLYKLYPNDEMNLNLSVSYPPVIKILKHDIDVIVYLDVVINVLDSNEVVPVACISLVSNYKTPAAFMFPICFSWTPFTYVLFQVISTSLTPKILANNLIGSIRLINFSASLKWSNIGNLHMQLVQVKYSVSPWSKCFNRFIYLVIV